MNKPQTVYFLPELKEYLYNAKKIVMMISFGPLTENNPGMSLAQERRMTPCIIVVR